MVNLKKRNFNAKAQRGKTAFAPLRLCVKILSLLLFLSAPLSAEMVVVICSYNNQEWYERNLDSVFSQNFDKYRVIYIDDCSPDGTGNLVQQYIQKNKLESRVTLIQNTTRVGALANLYKAIWMCAQDEVVVNLDGDDWFPHRDVLSHLARVYEDKNVWLTYGQYIYYPKYEPGLGEEIKDHVIQENSFRTCHQGTTALRTFYAGLFHQIKKEDLLYEGEFFTAGYDLAIMLPMLEMAGRHSRFIPEINYVYNIQNQINDHKVRFDEQADADRYIRKKEKYQPLLHYAQKETAKKIYITPGAWGELFAIDNPIYNRDGCLEVLYKLRQIAAEKGYELEQANSLDHLADFEYLICFDIFQDQLAQLERFPKEKLVAFLWEPPTIFPDNYNRDYHRYFSKIYTWRDDLVDNKKYFKFYYPVYRPLIPMTIDFYWKRLSTMVACNKYSDHPQELYSERRRVIDFYEELRNDDFDLFGKAWPAQYRTYRGPIDKKVDFLPYYRFSYCYENVYGIPGYVTEKIFDCFQSGTVPIYWGAPNVTDYIPKNCFIAREDFASDFALYEYLKNMDAAQYDVYMKNIEQFLQSDKARLYSIDNFIRIFMELITCP